MNATPLPFAGPAMKTFIRHLLAFTTLLGTSAIISAAFISAAFVNAACAPQQMELREREEYNEDNFKKSSPAVGSLAPNMKLKTIDGKTVTLDSYRGKNIVVIKAGYT